MNSCILCDIAEGTAVAKPENLPFAANELAFAKPGLGHFVEGYSLIIARDHVRAFAEMSKADLGHVEEFKEAVRLFLARAYHKPVVVFEHGCGPTWQQRGGACIDHAHLHMLPLECCLKKPLARHFRFRSISSIQELAYRENRNAYLYLETAEGERLLFDVDVELPSQFMRRLICEMIGQPSLWDWRTHPFRERISEFNLTMARFLAARRIENPL